MSGLRKAPHQVPRETGTPRPQPADAAPWPPERWLPEVQAALAAQGWPAEPPQALSLARYMAMLQRWNATYNLTSLRSPADMRTHHLADCLAVVAPLAQQLAHRPVPAPAVLDVGSGGGLPGVVLAILLPQVTVTCVDTVGKKAAFIRQAAAELGLRNLRSEHQRVEKLQGQFHVVTSRAFASLHDFTAWTAHLLAPGAVWMAMKGRAPEPAELDALAPSVKTLSVQPLAVPGLDAERCLVWLKPEASPA